MLQLINVANSISVKDTYERELKGLLDAIKRLQMSEAKLIIGDGNRNEVLINDFKISIIPA
jgi:hypothetical protein